MLNSSVLIIEPFHYIRQMSKFQVVSVTKLKEMLEQRNLWLRMRSGRLRAVERATDPAKISPGGTSYIISYYDRNSRNFFTIHRIVTKGGDTIHEHAKDAFIDGVRYKAKIIYRGEEYE